jgi:hypothetical protein
MKLIPFVKFASVFMFAGTIARADVTFGDVTFDASSADVSDGWLDPMPVGVTKSFEGFGANAGQTRTISFSDGGEVGGVKTLKRHLVDKAAAGLPGTTPAEKAEDIWIAFDAADNARVLKIVRAGATVFEATAAATPPLYLPADPQEGQSWEVAGTTVTLDQVMGSRSGYRLKVTYTNAAGESHSDFLHAGEGVLRTESGASGWQPKPAQGAE